MLLLFCDNSPIHMRRFLRLISTALDQLDNLESSDWPWGRMVFGGLFYLILLTVFNWRLMIPFWLLVVSVVLYLRYSRPKDSL